MVGFDFIPGRPELKFCSVGLFVNLWLLLCLCQKLTGTWTLPMLKQGIRHRWKPTVFRIIFYLETLTLPCDLLLKNFNLGLSLNQKR